MHSVIVHRTSLLRFKFGERRVLTFEYSEKELLPLAKGDTVEISVRSWLGWWVAVGRYEPGVGRADRSWRGALPGRTVHRPPHAYTLDNNTFHI